MEYRKILVDAAELLERPGAWTQGARARNALGAGVTPWDASAICFCVMGAIERVSDVGDHKLVEKAFDAFRSQVDRISIGNWNDNEERTQAEVVAALRKAAEREWAQ